MTSEEYLLQKLSEECAEVQQAISKILCFGLHETYPERGKTNEQYLYAELNDLNASVEMLNEAGVLHYLPSRKAVDAKKIKVEKWMEYSEKCGKLIPTL